MKSKYINTKTEVNIINLQTFKPLTAGPQHIFYLFKPRNGEVFGKSQGYIPNLRGEKRVVSLEKITRECTLCGYGKTYKNLL